MSSLFNEEMTYAEAQRRFFDAAIGKDKDEKERVKSEYLAILPIITKRELSEYAGRLTSHPL